MQVRATPDNKKEILAAVKAVKCENVANFTAGFEYAFELLHRVRVEENNYIIKQIDNFRLFFNLKYNQSSQGAQCNQAIMLITDGISETHTDVSIVYNKFVSFHFHYG